MSVAAAANQHPASATETDPESLGWMKGFPPAPDRTVAFQDGSLQSARRSNGLSVPADAVGETIGARWREAGDGPGAIATLVRSVSADTELWGTDLSAIPGFVESVTEHLSTLREQGAVAAIESLGLAPVR